MPPAMSSLTGCALDLDVQQVVREVVAWVLPVVGDLGVDVVAEIVHPLLGAGLFGDPLDHVVDELAEEVVVLGGEAEHPADHADRDVLGVLHRRIDDGLARRDVADLVEEFLAEALDLGFPRLDLLRRERRQEQPPRHVVERRVAGDRRCATDRRGHREITGAADRHDHGAAGEVLGVVRDLVHRVVGDRHPHAAVAIGVRHRAAALAEFLPHRRRVGVVLRHGMVEVGREVGHRAVVGGVVGNALPDVGPFRAGAEGRDVVGASSGPGRVGRRVGGCLGVADGVGHRPNRT